MSYYKRKDLLNSEVVVLGTTTTCAECKERISKKDTPISLKFFSKKTIYIHSTCHNSFMSKVR